MNIPIIPPKHVVLALLMVCPLELENKHDKPPQEKKKSGSKNQEERWFD